MTILLHRKPNARFKSNYPTAVHQTFIKSVGMPFLYSKMSLQLYLAELFSRLDRSHVYISLTWNLIINEIHCSHFQHIQVIFQFRFQPFEATTASKIHQFFTDMFSKASICRRST